VKKEGKESNRNKWETRINWSRKWRIRGQNRQRGIVEGNREGEE
jgi:hypothetical protein